MDRRHLINFTAWLRWRCVRLWWWRWGIMVFWGFWREGGLYPITCVNIKEPFFQERSERWFWTWCVHNQPYCGLPHHHLFQDALTWWIYRQTWSWINMLVSSTKYILVLVPTRQLSVVSQKTARSLSLKISHQLMLKIPMSNSWLSLSLIRLTLTPASQFFLAENPSSRFTLNIHMWPINSQCHRAKVI